MAVPRSKGKIIVCKLRIDCPFCKWATKPGDYIKLSRDEHWMHPRCADYADAGKSFKDLQYDRQFARSFRKLNAGKGEAEQRAPSKDHASDYF